MASNLPDAVLTSPRKSPSKWLTLLAACGGLMMLYIDLFIVNVALPAIGRDLNAPLSSVSWIIAGYVLMIGVFPMGMGRLGDIWGHRKMYLTGLAIFVLASFACGLAQSIEMLIAFRVLQGFGAAIMTPVTLAIVIRAFPPEQRGLAIGLHGGVSGLGLVLGPLLGGLLVQLDSWRLVFFVNVPVGIVAVGLTFLFVRESRDESIPPTIDWGGLLFLSLGLFGLMLAFTMAEIDSWTSISVVASLVFALASFFFFVKVEQRVQTPLIDLALFRNRTFVFASLSFFFFSAALFGSQPYWSLFMQNYWGFTPLQGGLAYLPATGLIAILTPLSGILAQKAGKKVGVVALFGICAMGASFIYVFLVLAPGSGYFDGLFPAFIIRGFSIPIFSACTSLMVVNSLPLTKAGLAAGTLGMVRNVGTALGISLLSASYLHQINTAVPQQLPNLTPLEQTSVLSRASQFIPAGSGGAYPVVEEIILQGFIQLCLISALACGIALVAIICMRKKPSRVIAIQESIVTPGSVRD